MRRRGAAGSERHRGLQEPPLVLRRRLGHDHAPAGTLHPRGKNRTLQWNPLNGSPDNGLIHLHVFVQLFASSPTLYSLVMHSKDMSVNGSICLLVQLVFLLDNKTAEP